MSELSKFDAELAYRYLPETLRADIDHDAHMDVVETWQDDHPDDLAALDEAADDPDHEWGWGRLYAEFEVRGPDREELVAIDGMPAGAELEDVANDFAWDYVEQLREHVRDLQQSTDFGPREFVGLVVAQHPNMTREYAAKEMDIEQGTLDSWFSRDIDRKIEAAKETLRVAEAVGRKDDS